MSKTVLDINDPHHQLLVGMMAMFVDDFGYKPRDLYILLDDCKRQLFGGLQEIHSERIECHE